VISAVTDSSGDRSDDSDDGLKELNVRTTQIGHTQ